MIRLRFLPALAGLAMLGACSVVKVEEPSEPFEVDQDWREVSVSASFFREGTRMAVDDQTGDFTWQEGDEISVFNIQSGASMPLALTDGAGTGDGVFSGSVPEGSLSNIAFFPHNSGHTLSTFRLPAEYSWREGYAPMPMVARNMTGDGSSVNLGFKLLSGIFVFTMTGMPSEAKAFRFITPGMKIAGDFPVDTSTETPLLEVREGADDDVTVHFSEGKGTMKFSIPVPVGAYNQIVIQVLDEDGEVLFQKVYDTAVEVERRDVFVARTVAYQAPSYVKVTEAPEDWSGNYVLVSGSKLLSSIEKIGSSSCGIAADVLITDQRISCSEYGQYNIQIEKSGSYYTMRLETGTGAGFLGWTSGNTLMSSPSATGDNLWNISSDNSGNVVISHVSDQNRKLQYNSSAPRFCCYTSSQNAVQLYKREGFIIPSVKPVIFTKAATEVSVSSGLMNASFANLGTTDVQDAHFVWGYSEDSMVNELYAQDFVVETGKFQARLSSLEEGVTIYYRAVLQYCVDGTNYILLSGQVLSFTTLVSSTEGNAGLQWLGCYEMPAIDLQNQSSYSGRTRETNANNLAYCYSYFTRNNRQRAVTHSYVYDGKTYRNYTAYVDGDKLCPLWVAQVVHAEAYPDMNVRRNENWVYDPGIPDTWQQSGLKNVGTVGYSKGHFCASDDRQTCVDANKETFYYSNQAPQWQKGFNGGIWSSLEQAVVEPTGSDTLYVVTGVLFEGTIQTLPTNDNKQASIPSHFYKLLMKCSFNASGEITDAKGIAYLYTNEAHTKETEGRTVTYHDDEFVTTIDAIEQRTGFNFFANVPPGLQVAAESVATQLWNY